MGVATLLMRSNKENRYVHARDSMYGSGERAIVRTAVFLRQPMHRRLRTPFTQKSRTTNHVRAVYKTRNTSAALSCGETLVICILRLQFCAAPQPPPRNPLYR